MTTHVRYRGVGESSDSAVPMTTADMSSRLLEDWTPWLPLADGSKLLGWPQHLVSATTRGFLALDAKLERSERQWKTVVSWMLGVACARHVLWEKESYKWIAPASAFYKNPKPKWTVDLGDQWHELLPQSRVSVDKDLDSESRLRPDYLALRSTSANQSAIEWAAVESKGVSKALPRDHACPPRWRAQARNITVHVDDQEVAVERHLVIATRLVPGKPIQVRAWNSTEEAREPRLPLHAAVEIVAAHLFGLLRSIGLAHNAQAIALGVQRRAAAHRSTREPSASGQQVDDLLRRAEVELRPREPDGTRVVDMDAGARVEITEPVATLIQRLQRSDNDADAVSALLPADAALDKWYAATTARGEHDRIVLPYGIEVRFPRDFART